MKRLKLTSIYLLALLVWVGCNNDSTTDAVEQEEVTNSKQVAQSGDVILIVNVKSELAEDELVRIAKKRRTEFAKIPGLVQKYYVKTGKPGEYRGVYIWDSKESLKKYKESELAATIAKAYKLSEPPTFEVGDIMFGLRE